MDRRHYLLFFEKEDRANINQQHARNSWKKKRVLLCVCALCLSWGFPQIRAPSCRRSSLFSDVHPPVTSLNAAIEKIFSCVRCSPFYLMLASFTTPFSCFSSEAYDFFFLKETSAVSVPRMPLESFERHSSCLWVDVKRRMYNMVHASSFSACYSVLSAQPKRERKERRWKDAATIGNIV